MKKANRNTQPLLLGAHISGAGSLHEALLIGDKLGCTTIQIFTKSNRRWAFDLIDQEEQKLFIKTQNMTSIKIVVSHAGYLINLCSPKKDIFEKSLKGLRAELERCKQLHIPYLVLHPGSRLDSTEQDAIKQLAEGIDALLESYKGKTMILLENMAGQGSSMGAHFEQLAEMREKITHKKLVGFCLDTCHAFAAGYTFSTASDYEAFIKHFDKAIGLTHLKVMHVNDSMREYNSHVDRHEWIGKGKIGIEAFAALMNDQRLNNIPKIIETPFETLKDHQRNLSVLQKLIH